MNTRFITPFSFPFWATLTLLIAPGLGSTLTSAQTVEPIFPLPNTINEPSTDSIELKLTEQPQIKLDTIQVLLNESLINGNLSINTRDKSLFFQATPENYNFGDNTLTVQFETQAGVQSQFTWTFIIGIVEQPPDETLTETADEETVESETPTIPLAPELTTQSISNNILVLAGKTQPGATITFNITATQPSTPLINLGAIVISGINDQKRQMSESSVADSEGHFRIEFDVTEDPDQTQYKIEVIAVQEEEEETTTITLQR